MYRLNPTYRAALLSLIVCSLAAPAPSFGQQRQNAVRAFELLPEDDLSMDAKAVVDACSEVLDRRDFQDGTTVANGLRQRAQAYLFLRQPSKAKGDLDALASLQPKNIEARLMRVVVLALLEMRDEARKEAEATARAAPEHPKALLALGYVAALDQDFDAAIPLLEKAISLDRKDAKAYILRGMIYSQLDPAKCLEDLNRGLELSPYLIDRELGRIHFARGLSLALLNRPREALSSQLVAQKVSPKSFEVARELALVYADLGRFQVASLHAERCVSLDPDDPVGHALCAKYYSKVGRLAEARASAERTAKLGCEDKTVRCVVAEAYSAVGDYSAALRFYDKALTEDEDHFMAMVGKASLLATCPDAKLRDGALAVKLARKSLERKKTREFQKWAPAMALAEAYAEMADFDEAVRYAKKSLELAGPDFGRRQDWLDKITLFEKKMPFRTKAGK